MEEEQVLAGAGDPAMASLLPQVDKEGPKEEHEPEENHPRFKKVYGKMKHLERSYEDVQAKLSEKDASFNALLEHNNKLAEAINSLQNNAPKVERPNPVENPEEYDAYIKAQLTPRPEIKAFKAPEPTATGLNPITAAQVGAMSTMHDDYFDVELKVVDLMKTDSILRAEIMGSKNPPKALYEYYQKLNKDKADGRQENYDRGELEGGGYERQLKPSGLTKDQTKMALNLGLTPAQYEKQLAFMR
jgi:chromosome segregation ATPase